MGIRVLSFLLETVFYVMIGAALLRAYMNWRRINMAGQPGQFVMAVTNWLVKPLRRVLPKAALQSRLDWASLLAASLLALLYAVLWMLLVTGLVGESVALRMGQPEVWVRMLVFALRVLVRVALQASMMLVLVYAILSWFQPTSPIYSIVARLAEPLLAPLRRFVPRIGGVDLSALVFLLLVQIILLVLG